MKSAEERQQEWLRQRSETIEEPNTHIDWVSSDLRAQTVENIEAGIPLTGDVGIDAIVHGGLTTGETPWGQTLKNILLPMEFDPENPVWFPGAPLEQGGAGPQTGFLTDDPFAVEGRWPEGRTAMYGGDLDARSGRTAMSAEGLPLEQRYYNNGDQARLWNQYEPAVRDMYEQRMVNAGLLEEGEFVPGDRSILHHNAWASVLSMANYYGVTPWVALNNLERLGAIRRANAGRGSGGGGRGTTAYTIPDYDSIAQQSKDMFRSMFGHRDPEDWELKMVADKMQEKYRSAAETQIQARLAGNGEFEVPDPQLATKAYVEETWEDELSRLKDIDTTAATHNVLISAATGGARLMGGQ